MRNSASAAGCRVIGLMDSAHAIRQVIRQRTGQPLLRSESLTCEERSRHATLPQRLPPHFQVMQEENEPIPHVPVLSGRLPASSIVQRLQSREPRVHSFFLCCNDPGGVTVIIRGLSASDTPGTRRPFSTDPGGVAANRSCRLAPLQGASSRGAKPTGGVADGQPPANGCHPSRVETAL